MSQSWSYCIRNIKDNAYCAQQAKLLSWSEIKLQCPLLACLLYLSFFVSVAYASSGNASAFWKQKLFGYLNTSLISLWFCDKIYSGSENEMHCCVPFHRVFSKGVRWGMSDKRKQILLRKQTLFLPFFPAFFSLLSFDFEKSIDLRTGIKLYLCLHNQEVQKQLKSCCWQIFERENEVWVIGKL